MLWINYALMALGFPACCFFFAGGEALAGYGLGLIAMALMMESIRRYPSAPPPPCNDNGQPSGRMPR